MYFLSYSGFILNYGEEDIVDGKDSTIKKASVAIKYPPTISFIKYTGETFADGIISQGDTLPSIANDKNLFIDTSENIIYRFDASANPGMPIDATGPSGNWVSIGGDIDLSNYYTKNQVYNKIN